MNPITLVDTYGFHREFSHKHPPSQPVSTTQLKITMIKLEITIRPWRSIKFETIPMPLTQQRIITQKEQSPNPISMILKHALSRNNLNNNFLVYRFVFERIEIWKLAAWRFIKTSKFSFVRKNRQFLNVSNFYSSPREKSTLLIWSILRSSRCKFRAKFVLGSSRAERG